MNTPKFKIEFSDNFLAKNIVDTDFNIIPHPVVIYLSLTQEIFMNDKASIILNPTNDDSFDVRILLDINKHLFEDIEEKKSNSSSKNEIKLTLLNGKEIRLEFSYNILNDDTLGPIYFAAFIKNTVEVPVESVFSMSMVKDEILKLTDSLNNEGKKKLNDILKQYFNKEQKHLSLDDLVNYEKELQIIQKEFPVLSRREVLLCGLIAHDMELSDIATITNRSLNSVFVTVHRINKKTNINNKVELTKALRSLINNYED